MSIVINTNVASLNAQRLLTNNTNALSKNLERLASGFRINRAADDAAGLQISENLRAQIRGVNQAINNSQDGFNLLSVAEGTLSVVQENLQRIRELVVQAANDTNGANQRAAIQQEIDARIDDIARITQATEYNGIKLLDGTVTSLRLQVGANADVTLDTIDINADGAFNAATAADLGLVGPTAIGSNGDALALLGQVDTALTEVSERRATIGSLQNRLESAINNLLVTKENFEASESRIRNVDVAKESADLTRNQILQQASASILAQANQTPFLALNLIQGR
jgi:flagellin